MRGHLDKKTIEIVSGWVFDAAQPDTSLEIKLTLADQTIATTTADVLRPDLRKITRGNGRHGFRFTDLGKLGVRKADLGKIEYFIKDRKNEWKPFKPSGGKRKPAGQYQSFDDASGASKTSEKLKALRLSQLPNRHSTLTPLKGLSVLDIGCNEGFFCGEALRHGAKRVLGIDASAGIIERAKQRFNDAEFRVGSWWDLPDEKFDVIFFLSAIHYEPEQRKLLDKLSRHLTPTGTLVLECGIGNVPGKSWEAVKRWDGVRRYPNHRLLTEELLVNFAPSLKGPSVIQSGDPVERFVYHCPVKQASVLVFAGGFDSGAASPLNDLARQGSAIFNVDHLLGQIISTPRYDWTQLKDTLSNASSAPEESAMAMAQALLSAGKDADLADLIALEAPTYGGLTVIEGEVLRHPAIHAAVTSRLIEAGFATWGVVQP